MNKRDTNRLHNELWGDIKSWYLETPVDKWKCISAVKADCIDHMGETEIFMNCFMCEYFRNGKINNRNKEGRGCTECPLYDSDTLIDEACPPYRDLHHLIQHSMCTWWKIRDHGMELPTMKEDWERELHRSMEEVIKQIDYIRTRRIK